MSIEHDREAHRFTSDVASGTAVLAYTPAGPGVLELYSTYVPSADRGKGVAVRVGRGSGWLRAKRRGSESFSAVGMRPTGSGGIPSTPTCFPPETAGSHRSSNEPLPSRDGLVRLPARIGRIEAAGA